MGGRVASAARTWLAPFVDFLYPPVCFLCSEGLDAAESVVCDRCWGMFTRADPAHPVWRELAGRARAGGVDEILACWLFEKEGTFREAVHLLKYRRARSVGARVGEELGRAVCAHPGFARADLLVPVPLHPARRRERTYNQSELLAEGIARATGIPVERSLLVRTGRAASQTLVGGGSRRANVAGAFAIDRARAALCAGKTCIVVDDVMTTGATLLACAELLRTRAHAARVLGACAALAR